MLPKVNVDVSEDTQKSFIRGAAKALEPFGIGVSLLSDKLAYHRFKCLVEIAEKAKVSCEKYGIAPKPVQNKFLARFVEEASYEDNPDLQGMWANLLVRMCVGEDHHSVYLNILRELDSFEANILNDVYGVALNLNYKPDVGFISRNHKGEYSMNGAPAINFLNVAGLMTSKEYSIHIKDVYPSRDNVEKRELRDAHINAFEVLQNMGALEVVTSSQNFPNGDIAHYVHISITPLGFRFVEACTTLRNISEER